MTAHLLTPQDVADRWQRPVQWVRQQARAGQIPGATRLGHTWRFDPDGIDTYEQRRSTWTDPLSMTPLSAARRRGKQAS